jgi:hypothetical protein
MLDPSHYDVVVKYDKGESLDFNAEELALMRDVLDLNISTFTEARLPEYRTLINKTVREQERVMTEIGGEYLIRKELSEVEAFRYVVDNIDRIKSPYMLNILVGLLAYREKPGGR